MKHRIDVMRLREGTMTLNGWAIPRGQNQKYTELPSSKPTDGKTAEETDGKVLFVKNADGVMFRIFRKTAEGTEPVRFSYVPMRREDVAGIYHCGSMCGFDISFPYEHGTEYFLEMREAGSGRTRALISDEAMAKRSSVANRKKERLLALCSTETVRVAWDYFKANGLFALWKKSVHKLQGIEEDYDYSEWYEKTKPTEKELSRQAERFRALAEKIEKEGPQEGNPSYPLFSVAVPAYNTPEKYLCMLYDSLQAQTYPNFELVVADGSDADDRTVETVTARYAAEDKRFRYVNLGGNRGISENTNEAIRRAKGDFLVLCDHDDELTKDALCELWKAIAAHKDGELFYSDEDKVDFDGRSYFEPHFKPDYNPDLLRTVNYICHLTAIRRSLLERVAAAHPQGLWFDPAYDGAQDHDFFLRCTEEAQREEKTQREEEKMEQGTSVCPGTPGNRSEKAAGIFTGTRIIHIPKVLYHWRCHKNSTSANPESKLYAFESGRRAVLQHERRMGIRADHVENGVTYGFYHTIYADTDDCISVVIPNKDHVQDLDKCIRSIVQRSVHRQLEFIIVENNSTEPETFDYYQKIENNPAYFLTDFDKGYEKLQREREDFREYCRTAKGVTDLWQTPVTREELSDVSGIRIHTIFWKDAFNYSAINNFGASAASGSYLLFLNNDVELIDPGSFVEMLGLLSRPDVGIVGARLLYEDNTVQHAGVVVGFGGIAGGCFIGLHERENSYMHRMRCVQDYSAVTAACLMTRRDVFERAGGFTEELAVAFNDIDFCMKVRAQGFLCVYDPYVLLHHYESKSRGLEDTPEKIERFNGEIAIFASRWPEILKNGDPYYNPNLTLRKSNFTLRDLSREKIGEPYKLELDVEKQLREVRRVKQSIFKTS